MIQINGAARLPPTMEHDIDPRRVFTIEAAGIATIVLSVAAVVILLATL